MSLAYMIKNGDCKNGIEVLNVHANESLGNLYFGGSVNFAVCSDIIKTKYGKFAYQMTNMHTCREITIERFSKELIKDKRNITQLPYANIPTKRLNILFFFLLDQKSFGKINNINRGIKNSLRIINIIEGILRFPKSKLYICNFVHKMGDNTLVWREKKYSSNQLCYLFSGSKNFMFSKHLMSLYLLLLRIPLYGTTTVFDNVNSLESFLKACENHALGTHRTDTDNILARGNNTEITIRYYKYWMPFLKHWKEIYKDRMWFQNFRQETFGHEDDGTEGIKRLIKNSSKDIYIQNRFNDIIKMYKINQ